MLTLIYLFLITTVLQFKSNLTLMEFFVLIFPCSLFVIFAFGRNGNGVCVCSFLLLVKQTLLLFSDAVGSDSQSPSLSPL